MFHWGIEKSSKRVKLIVKNVKNIFIKKGEKPDPEIPENRLDVEKNRVSLIIFFDFHFYWMKKFKCFYPIY
jgi:hypothetical protein